MIWGLVAVAFSGRVFREEGVVMRVLFGWRAKLEDVRWYRSDGGVVEGECVCRCITHKVRDEHFGCRSHASYDLVLQTRS